MNIREQLLEYRPPRIAMLLTLMAIATHWLIPLAVLPAFPVAAALAGALGFAVMMRAWWLFKKHETAICPTAETSVLITGDIYALTRNPMYLGMILMLLGCALLAGTMPFYAVCFAYFAVINYAFCPYEEQKLQAAFGEEFQDYRRRTRRWV